MKGWRRLWTGWVQYEGQKGRWRLKMWQKRWMKIDVTVIPGCQGRPCLG
jgi:hypothetical protein